MVSYLPFVGLVMCWPSAKQLLIGRLRDRIRMASGRRGSGPLPHTCQRCEHNHDNTGDRKYYPFESSSTGTFLARRSAFPCRYHTGGWSTGARLTAATVIRRNHPLTAARPQIKGCCSSRSSSRIAPSGDDDLFALTRRSSITDKACASECSAELRWGLFWPVWCGPGNMQPGARQKREHPLSNAV